MKLRFLGTGDARQVPLYGCRCDVCLRARASTDCRRTACSAVLEVGEERWLLDAGQHDLRERFPPGSLSGILLTHYHMDHVAGLFPLRWGIGDPITVLGPDDNQGCDDLFKHPGILSFEPALLGFQSIVRGELEITPVPLIHSRPCFGYIFARTGRPGRLAYLTDTVGLPQTTLDYLQANPVDWLIIDCTHPPQMEPPRNHNDWSMVEELIRQIRPSHTWLTHIGHDMDAWLLQHQLPDAVTAARDGLALSLRAEALPVQQISA